MKKTIAFLLFAVMMLTLLAACDDAGDTSSAPVSDSPSSTAVSDTASEVESAEESSEAAINYLDYIYTGNDYVGRTLTVLTSGVNAAPDYSEIVYNEGFEDSDVLPETVNEAIKRRNDAVEELLGVTIKEIYFHDPKRYGGDTLARIRNNALNPDGSYQAVSVCLYDCGTLAMDGYLHDFRSLENINLDNPWWDQSFNESVNIAGSQYFALGDMQTIYKGCLGAIFYNKTLLQKLGLEDPQDLALSGQWTMDKLIELATSYNEDINNTPGIQWDDCYGLAGQNSLMVGALYGAGVRILSLDAQGYPYLTLWSETANNAVEKSLELMLNSDYFISGNDLFGRTPYQWPMQALAANFLAGNVLFYAGGVGDAITLSNTDDDIGILPYPKFTAEQDRYYSQLGTWSVQSIAIPVGTSVEDAEFVAAVLDAMCYYSWEGHSDSVAVAYFERALKMQKLHGDEKSLEILGIIFDTAGSDLGDVFQVGNLSGTQNVHGMLAELVSGKRVGQFRSAYEAREGIYQNDTETIVEFFKNQQ